MAAPVTNMSDLIEEATAPAAPVPLGSAGAGSTAGAGAGSGAGEKPLAPRKERSKSRDMGKRMGGGQKGVWGNTTEILTAVKAVDNHDPNFDSEGEENVVLVSSDGSPVRKSSLPPMDPDPLVDDELRANPPPEIKKRIIEILDEYLTSGDAEEVKSSLIEMDAEPFKYEVVKRAITMSMDKNDKEREMVSRLLSELYLNGLTPSQIATGFRRVLLHADDLQIDIPNAKNMLAIFAARAIVDELLPPKFLEDPFINRFAPDVAAEAIKKLSIKHATARMEKGWGPGDGRPVEELKVAIDHLTKEYLLSRDLEEAARCVRELNVPHFHHEVVKRGITNALEEGGELHADAMSSLLAYLVAQEIVSGEQLRKGVEKFKLVLDDVVLDIPNAGALFQGIVARAKSDGILPSDFDGTTKQQ
ncbi:hypothetical protein P43SY_004668 [Pythium insidiosum]|uniref:MI domain-containing protein n=1 Tax=Pythium insidiosum TaxID=114742 RepID=A0AAD5LIF6_PYTIN|nr:hypothetical protein P43SY_004668 [Pythium insidiosum]